MRKFANRGAEKFRNFYLKWSNQKFDKMRTKKWSGAPKFGIQTQLDYTAV